MAFQLAACHSNNVSLSSVEDLWDSHPEKVRSLIQSINLLSIPTADNYLHSGDTVMACRELLLHFKNMDRGWIVNSIDPMDMTEAVAISEKLNRDSVLIHDIPASIPRLEGGGWDWTYQGPDNDAEFAYSLNTQSYLIALYKVWSVDHKDHHISVFNSIVKDWALNHPLPEEGDSIYLVLNQEGNIDYRDIGEVEWRTLDTGRRLGSSWVQLFYAFLGHESFEPSTQLLMLSSIAEQAEFIRKYHKSGHNWTTMEMNGLALVGLAMPEFKQAAEWSDYALDVMSKEIQRQVYPDGVQTEISSKTQWVALRRFESLAKNFQSAGRSIDSNYMVRIGEMYDYLAFTLRPDGHQPLNNDSDRDNLRDRLQVASDKFNRSDWQYVISNGSSGTLPQHPLSYTYPWAGIQIHRSGWDSDASWAFFDLGPYGTGHQHRDMLHLSIADFGQDLLVDGGRFTHKDYFSFDPTIERGYFRSSWSHNVILVDHRGQNAGPLKAEKPLKEGLDYIHAEGFDTGIGRFVNGYTDVDGEVIHTRSVTYLKDHHWLVVDQIETDKPRDITALWHLAPDLEVVIEDENVKTKNMERANIEIHPLSDSPWTLKLVQGQSEPHLQGWYSAEYGVKLANPTIEYHKHIQKTSIFAWLITAKEGLIEDQNIQFRQTNNFLILEYTDINNDVKSIIYPLNHNLRDIVVRRQINSF
ncbi:hypothetical protein GCM10025777_21740 [Membranihabitans marinus]